MWLRRWLVGLALCGCLYTVGCGGYGSSPNNMMAGTGTPQISQLVPNSAMSGAPGFSLTVNGSGFGSDAVVYWNASVRNTTYVTANQVTAAISAPDIAMKGTAQVYVHTNGQNSNTMNFTVN